MYNHLNRCIKSIGQNLTSVKNKNSLHTRNRREFSKLKGIYEQSTNDIILNIRIKCFSLKIKTRMSTFATSIQYCLTKTNSPEEEMKGIERLEPTQKKIYGGQIST